MIFTGTGNANKILGIPVQTGTPSDTFTLLYDAASSRWIFGPSGTPPAGGVGGGANLTTVGSVPFVTSSGVLGQNTNFRFFNGTGNLVVGTTTDDGVNRLQVAGSARIALTAAQTGLQVVNTTTFSSMDIIGATEGNITLQDTGAPANQQAFNLNVNDGALLFRVLNDARTGVNAVFGRLSANGEWRFHDERATVGSTSLVVRAGAGQSGNLQTWQNSSGTALTSIASDGGLNTFGGYFAQLNAGGTLNEVLIQNAVDLASGRLIRYSSTTNATGTKDLSLSRASANVLQVGDGGSNSNGIILSRRVQSAGETVASLPAAAAGNAGTISYVTDSNSTTIGATVAGGGANKVLVWSNGTAWKIFAN